MKIVTIPEDQLREAAEGEGEDGVRGRPSENKDSVLSAAMSKLLDSLLVSFINHIDLYSQNNIVNNFLE